MHASICTCRRLSVCAVCPIRRTVLARLRKSHIKKHRYSIRAEMLTDTFFSYFNMRLIINTFDELISSWLISKELCRHSSVHA